MYSNFLVDTNKKISFLNDCKNNTYEKLLTKIDRYENENKKTVLEMDLNDIRQFLTKQKNLSSIRSYATVWKQYVEYIYDGDEKSIGYISIQQITSTFKYDCFDKKALERKYITEKEYYDIIKNHKGNMQDKLVIILLWHLIKGKAYEDILNIKLEDINVENKYIKINNLDVYFNDYEMEIINKAIEEKNYIYYYGKKSVSTYVESEYLIKIIEGTINKNNHSNRVSTNTFQNNFSKYRKLVLKKPDLDGISIYNSSIYYHMLLEFNRRMNANEIASYFKSKNEKFNNNQAYIIQDIMINKLIKENLFFYNTDMSNDDYSDLDAVVINNNQLLFDVEFNIDELGSDIHSIGIEGELKYYLGKRYERSKKLRNLAIQIHGSDGLNCYVCDFNFEEKYGNLGKEYIEVHHRTPLYEKGKILVNPYTDLIILCSNCHRIIHRNKKNVIDCEYLKNIVKK